MKRLIFFPVMFLLFAFPIYASGNFSAGIFAGPAFPTGSLGDLYDAGIGLGGYVEYRLNPALSIIASTGFYRWSESGEVTDGQFTETFEISLYTVPFLGGFRYYFLEENVAPYIEAAAGLHYVSWEDTFLGQTDSESGTDYGFGIGAGTLLFINPAFQIDVRIKYHSINTEGDALTYISGFAGVRFVF